MALALLLVCGFLAIIPASIAQTKGKKFWNWFIFGFFLFIPAIICAVLIQEESKESTNKVIIEKTNSSFNTNSVQRIDLNEKVQISKYNLIQKDNKLYVKVSLKNNTKIAIKAVKITAKGANSFGDSIFINGNDTFLIILQDINVQDNENIEIDRMYLLPDDNIRSLSMRVLQYVDANGKVYDMLPPYIVECNKQALSNRELDYTTKYISNAKYHYIEYEKYWQCVCGMVNLNEKSNCSCCNLTKKNILCWSSNNIEETINNLESQQLQEDETKKDRCKKEILGYVALGLGILSILTQCVFIVSLLLGGSAIICGTINLFLHSKYIRKRWAIVGISSGLVGIIFSIMVFGIMALPVATVGLNSGGAQSNSSGAQSNSSEKSVVENDEYNYFPEMYGLPKPTNYDESWSLEAISPTQDGYVDYYYIVNTKLGANKAEVATNLLNDYISNVEKLGFEVTKTPEDNYFWIAYSDKKTYGLTHCTLGWADIGMDAPCLIMCFTNNGHSDF